MSRWPRSSATTRNQFVDVAKRVGEKAFSPYRGFVADVTSRRRTTAMGELQILTFVGMLGSFDQILGDVSHCATHHAGRPPGRRPDRGQPWRSIDLDELFGIFAEQAVGN